MCAARCVKYSAAKAAATTWHASIVGITWAIEKWKIVPRIPLREFTPREKGERLKEKTREREKNVFTAEKSFSRSPTVIPFIGQSYRKISRFSQQTPFYTSTRCLSRGEQRVLFSACEIIRTGDAENLLKIAYQHLAKQLEHSCYAPVFSALLWWPENRWIHVRRTPECEGAGVILGVGANWGSRKPPSFLPDACHLRCSGLPLNYPNRKGLNALFSALLCDRAIIGVVGHSAVVSRGDARRYEIRASYFLRVPLKIEGQHPEAECQKSWNIRGSPAFATRIDRSANSRISVQSLTDDWII